MQARLIRSLPRKPDRTSCTLSKYQHRFDSVRCRLSGLAFHRRPARLRGHQSFPIPSSLFETITATTNLEHIGDIIDKNLRELAEKKIRKRYRFSEEGLAEIRDFHRQVSHSLQLSLNVLATRDIGLARQLFDEKSAMRVAERMATEKHYERLRSGVTQSLETSSIHLDVLRDLKRIHGHITSIAYPILEAADELRDTRLRRAGEQPAKEQPGVADGYGLALPQKPA